MLLPTKHLTADRSLLGIASSILENLESSATVDELWIRFVQRQQELGRRRIGFDWFLLALCALYAMRQVDFDGAALSRELSP